LAVNRDTLEKEKEAMEYMVELKKNKYTDSFFRGFKSIGADGVVETQSQVMTWDRKAAWKAAGFDKLAKDTPKVKKTSNKARKKRTMTDIQNAMKRKKRRI